MTDSPFIEDDEQPYPHHPILYLPRLNPRAESELFRFDEGQAYRLAEWCGGEVAVENAAQVVLTGGTPPTTARVGDWVLQVYGDDGPPWYVTVSPELYRMAWWPKGHAPDWPWRCYLRGEAIDQRPPSTPQLGPDDFPAVHHPIEYLPWLDTDTEFEVFQHRSGQTERFAQWCGGEITTDGPIVHVETDQGIEDVPVGDYVLIRRVPGEADEVYVERAATGFNINFWPVGRDPGWTHHCFYREAS